MLELLANLKSKENNINANEATKEAKAFVKKNEKIKNKIVLSNKNNHNKPIIKSLYIKFSILISISLVFLFYSNNKLIPDDFHAIKNKLRRTAESSNISISKIFRGLTDCSEDFIFENNGECVNNCSSIDFLQNRCKLIDENNIQHLDLIIDKIRQEMPSLEYSFLADDLKVKYKNVTFSVTTTNYMTSNENNQYTNETQIILGQVEAMIKEVYNLPKNQTILIYKLDYYLEEFLIPITEYLIYIPGDLLSMDSEYLKNPLINIKIPVNINENEIYKYDPNSEYYNNSCYPDSYTPSQNCQDQKILNLRKIEYNEGNMPICEINCVFLSYDSTTKKVECQCPLKKASSFSLFSEIYNTRSNRTNLFFYFDDIIYYTETTTVLAEETTNIPMAVITEEKMNTSITNELTDFLN